MLATLFLICSNKHRIEIDSITKSLNWLLSSTIIVQGGQYLGKVFGRPIIMLISVPGNTHNNMDWCLHFLQRYFCRAAKYDGYHIEMEKTDGGEGGEGFYLLGEVAESGSPFRRWVEVGAGFLEKWTHFISSTRWSLLNELESTDLLPTVRVLMCFGLSL